MTDRPTDRGARDRRGPDRQRLGAGLLAAGLAIVATWLLVAGSVTIGAGDSEGFSRRVDAVVRAADRALAATGWSDPWRIAVWACGAAALLLGLVLVWMAAGERDVVAVAGAGEESGTTRPGPGVYAGNAGEAARPEGNVARAADPGTP